MLRNTISALYAKNSSTIGNPLLSENNNYYQRTTKASVPNTFTNTLMGIFTASRVLYLVGTFLALLLYLSLDITFHTHPTNLVRSDINNLRNIGNNENTMIVEVNLRAPRLAASLTQKLDMLLKQTNFPDDKDLDEEAILSDPLTDLILESDAELDDIEPENAEVGETSIDDEEFDPNDIEADESEVDIEGDADAFLDFDNDSDEGLTDLEMKQREVQRTINRYRGPVRVALYVGAGTTTNARQNIPHVLSKCSNGNIIVDAFDDGSMANVGRLKHDVLFIPGGSAGRMYSEMAVNAKKKHRLAPQFKVRKFLERGGGYVGVCAGAYLAAGGKSGKSPLKISMFKTESGMLGDGYFSGSSIDETMLRNENLMKKLPGLESDLLHNSQLFYANGPIFKNETFKNDEFPQMKNPQVVMRMANDGYLRVLLGKKSGKQTHRRHQGLPLVVMNNFGKGRVVLSTGHPETDVHESTYNSWKKAKDPSACDSQEAYMLMSMVYLAAGRGPSEIEMDPVSTTFRL